MPQDRLSGRLPMPQISTVLLATATLAAGGMLVTSHFMRVSPHAALLHGNPVDRVQAVEELIKLGRGGVPDLVQALKNDNREIRLSALFGLGRIGPQAGDGINAVRQALADPDPGVRTIAIGTFWQIYQEPRWAVPILLEMLNDPNEDVRQSVVETLEEIGVNTIGLLVELILSESDPIRRHLWPILRKVSNTGTIPGLANTVRKMLDQSNPTIHDEALLSIVSWGQASAAEIRELLKMGAKNFAGSPTNDKGSVAVDTALRAIVWLGPEAVEFLPEVLELLDQHNPVEIEVTTGNRQPVFEEDKFEMHGRFQILLSILEQMQTRARSAVPLLVRRLEEFHPVNRIPVTHTLVEIGGDAEIVVSVLVPFLSKQVSDRNEPESSSRWKLRQRLRQAADVLVRVSPDEARQQATLLISQLGTAKTGINDAVLNILAGFGPVLQEADTVHFIPLISHQDQETRRLTIDMFANMGTAGAPAVPALIEQLEGHAAPRDPETNRRIIKALGQIGAAAKDAVAVLLDVIENPNSYVESVVPSMLITDSGLNVRTLHWSEIVSVTAISSLGKIGDDSPEVLSMLLRQMKATMSDRRVAAAKAMRTVKEISDPVLANLLSLLQDEVAAVRVQALLTTGNLSGDRTAAVKPIEELLSDTNPYVRQAAIMTLGKIGPAAHSVLPRLMEMQHERGQMDSSWYLRMTSHFPSWYDKTPDFLQQTMAQSIQNAISAIGGKGD